MFHGTDGLALIMMSLLTTPPAPPPFPPSTSCVKVWFSSPGAEPVRLVAESGLVTLPVDDTVLLLDEGGGGDGDNLANECNLIINNRKVILILCKHNMQVQSGVLQVWCMTQRSGINII